MYWRFDQAAHGDVFVPDEKLAALAKQAFGKDDLRPLAAIIGMRLEAQAEKPNLLLARAQDHVHGAVQMAVVARKNRLE